MLLKEYDRYVYDRQKSMFDNVKDIPGSSLLTKELSMKLSLRLPYAQKESMAYDFEGDQPQNRGWKFKDERMTARKASSYSHSLRTC